MFFVVWAYVLGVDSLRPGPGCPVLLAAGQILWIVVRVSSWHIPANTRRWPIVVLMLVHRLPRLPNINTILCLLAYVISMIYSLSGEHETLNQWWVNVGPTSRRRRANIASTLIQCLMFAGFLQLPGSYEDISLVACCSFLSLLSDVCMLSSLKFSAAFAFYPQT